MPTPANFHSNEPKIPSAVNLRDVPISIAAIKFRYGTLKNPAVIEPSRKGIGPAEMSNSPANPYRLTAFDNLSSHRPFKPVVLSANLPMKKFIDPDMQ